MPPVLDWTARSPEIGRGRALARAALAGNPSDGYGGAVLAVTLPAWQARAVATRADALTVEPESDLVKSTVGRFARQLEPGALDTELGWETSIPPLVGLGGSSALVIAVLRALCQLCQLPLGPERLASLALRIETDELGLTAGPQDRVAQAYEGLRFMDFSVPTSHGLGRSQPLDPELLPPLLIAWRTETGAPSGDVHRALRERHRTGDAHVRRTMTALGLAAHRARAALVERDLAAFGRFMDETFDLRRAMLDLDPRSVEMIEVARHHGASANYAGSGGAIVAASPRLEILEEVEQALRGMGCETGRPL
jgi:glucuronokinase